MNEYYLRKSDFIPGTGMFGYMIRASVQPTFPPKENTKEFNQLDKNTRILGVYHTLINLAAVGGTCAGLAKLIFN